MLIRTLYRLQGARYDAERTRRYVERLRLSIRQHDITCAGGPWPMAYLRLQKLLLNAIRSSFLKLSSLKIDFELETVAFIEGQIPSEAARVAQQLYETMAIVVHGLCTIGPELHFPTMSLVVRVLTSSLQKITPFSEQTYQAFACEFLTLPDITGPTFTQFEPLWLNSIAEHVNYKLLASALAPIVSTPSYGGYKSMNDSRNRLNVLGCFIYFHRYAHQFQNAQAYSSHKDFVHVISALLSSVADRISFDDMQRLDEGDLETVSNSKSTAISFAHKQIISLVNQESIGSLLWGTSNAPSSTGSGPELNAEAQQLASYALTLLRFFPRRGDEIRMWLYLGSTSSSALDDASGKMPAIKFFWQAARSCRVFRKISEDPHAVLRLLKDQPIPNGTGPGQNSSLVQNDWRIILVFLELYTFVLKMMDDEEFFSASSLKSTNDQTSGSSWATYNALPLDDVQDLTVFLKNLGFTMYFRAKDIVGEPQPESTGAVLSSYFRILSSDRDSIDPPDPPMKTAENGIAGLAGISLDYLKGLVTGLLRSVHQRDSRRKFLPENHWLMTSLFDMTSFIPDVVEEEENRHRIQEEDEDDDDKHDDFEMEEEDRNLHLVGTTRERNIRYHERLQRQQRKLSRKRYLQTVAPRSEILQNMPFFIPFTTRVQIFREFVRRDQVNSAGSIFHARTINSF